MVLTIRYPELGKIQYLFREAGVEPVVEYEEQITIRADVPEEKVGQLTSAITEATAGTAELKVGEIFLG